MEHSYLGRADHGAEALFLADPLRLIEEQKPVRPLPPLCVFVGTRDFLLDDSRRLHAAVQAHGTRSELHIYPDEIHAFHALPWREATRSCWSEKRRFLQELGLVS
jgi:acetyl esterase/lipase